MSLQSQTRKQRESSWWETGKIIIQALLLAMVVQRFRVELLPGQKLELAPAVTLRQKGDGLLVRTLTRRT